MRIIIGTVFFACTVLIAEAQEQIGLRSSNYSGVNSALLNPAATNRCLFKWDLNLLSGGFFVYNGYHYIENTNLIHAALNSGNLTFKSTNPEEIAKQPSQPLYYNFTDAQSKFDIGASGFLMGPSLSMRFKHFSLGLFLNGRMAFGANNLDPDIDHFSIDQWQFLETKYFDPMDVASLVWSEIGLNLSSQLIKRPSYTIDGGINIKYNLGFEGFYVHNENRAKATAYLDTLQRVNLGPVEYGIATGMARDHSLYTPSINGKGFGVDLGISYMKKSFDGRPYKWKLGISILDLGYIHFNNNAELHRLPQDTGYFTNYKQLMETLTIEKITAEASDQILGDPSLSLVGSAFTIYTPLGLSIQFDYPLSKNWFWGSHLVRRMDFNAQFVERENTLMTSLRYETKMFETGLHGVLYNDIHPRMGAWIRLGPLTLGSDNLASIFIKQPKMTGTDFYFALKINRFASGRSKRDVFEKCYFLK